MTNLELVEQNGGESHLDLEDFTEKWSGDPKGLANFSGSAMGRVGYKHLRDLFFAFSTSYFAVRWICERIDHLYKFYDQPLEGEKGKLFRELLRIESKNEQLIITDLDNARKLIISNAQSVYCLRFQRRITDWWEFTPPLCISQGVIVPSSSPGFYDAEKSKSVADLIILASNLVGFSSVTP